MRSSRHLQALSQNLSSRLGPGLAPAELLTAQLHLRGARWLPALPVSSRRAGKQVPAGPGKEALSLCWVLSRAGTFSFTMAGYLAVDGMGISPRIL